MTKAMLEKVDPLKRAHTEFSGTEKSSSRQICLHETIFGDLGKEMVVVCLNKQSHSIL